MDGSVFHSQENWHGTYYELAIELQPTRDTERLMGATRRLWMCDTLTGTWLSQEQFGRLLQIRFRSTGS